METIKRKVNEIKISDFELNIQTNATYQMYYKKLGEIYKPSNDQKISSNTITNFLSSAHEFDRAMFPKFIEKKLEIAVSAQDIVAYFNPDFEKNPIPAELSIENLPHYLAGCKYYKFFNANTGPKHRDFSLDLTRLQNTFDRISTDDNTFIFFQLLTFYLIDQYLDRKLEFQIFNTFMPAEARRNIETNKMYYFAKDFKDVLDQSSKARKGKTIKAELNFDYKSSFFDPIDKLFDKMAVSLKAFYNEEFCESVFMKNMFIDRNSEKDIREYERKAFPQLMKTIVLKNEEPFNFNNNIKPVKPDSNIKKRLLLEILKIINPSIKIRTPEEQAEQDKESIYAAYEIDYFNSVVFGK